MTRAYINGGNKEIVAFYLIIYCNLFIYLLNLQQKKHKIVYRYL